MRSSSAAERRWLGAGRDALGERRTGREDLDEVGADLEVGAHRLGDLLGPVGEVVHERHLHVGRELQRIARPAGGGDVGAGDQHARAGQERRVAEIEHARARGHVEDAADGGDGGRGRRRRIRTSP